MKKEEIMTKAMQMLSKTMFKLKKASPTIMVVGAAIGGVTATVLACKATLKAQDILAEHKTSVEKIHEAKDKVDSGEIQLSEGETYTEKDMKDDITKQYLKTGLKLAKVYAPAVGLGAASLGCMFGSHHIMTKRNATLTAAYIALEQTFNSYNAKDFVERWCAENAQFGVEKVIQGAKTESVPLGELKKLSEQRKLLFDEALMQFAMGNCIALEDTNGNRKLLKRRSDQKIDAVAAMMDAYIAWKLNREMFE